MHADEAGWKWGYTPYCCYSVQVNLPAHLVVIKSTLHYIGGMFQECSESQVLQMIGRAGRPQVKRIKYCLTIESDTPSLENNFQACNIILKLFNCTV